MAESVTAAVITSVTAIVVAVVSAIAAVITAVKFNRAKLEIEEYRDALKKDRDKALTVTQVLGEACALLQRIRDQISNLESELDQPEAAVQEISKSCDELVDLYSESHYMLSAEERHQFHEIKNLARSTAKKCNAILGGRAEMARDLCDLMGSFSSAQGTMIEDYNRWQSDAVGEDVDETVEQY